jgi:ketosteroid isomerase-like protein
VSNALGPNAQRMVDLLRPDGHIDREAFYTLLDPDVVWDMSRSAFPDTGELHGVEGVHRWFDGLRSAFGEVSYEIERLHEAGDRVAVEIHLRGRGPTSGIAVDYSFVPLITFRAGAIVRMERYDHWSQAMHAMGLAG